MVRLIPFPERFPPSAHPEQQDEEKAEQKPCGSDDPAADPLAWPGRSFWWEETWAAASFVSCKPLQN